MDAPHEHDEAEAPDGWAVVDGRLHRTFEFALVPGAADAIGDDLRVALRRLLFQRETAAAHGDTDPDSDPDPEMSSLPRSGRFANRCSLSLSAGNCASWIIYNLPRRTGYSLTAVYIGLSRE